MKISKWKAPKTPSNSRNENHEIPFSNKAGKSNVKKTAYHQQLGKTSKKKANTTTQEMKITTQIKDEVRKLGSYVQAMLQCKDFGNTAEEEETFNAGIHEATATLCAGVLQIEVNLKGWVEPEHILEACPSLKNLDPKKDEFQKTFETEILKFIEEFSEE